jgi:3-dehydroquinate synthase class II
MQRPCRAVHCGVLVHREEGGRHFGMKIDEPLQEK